MPEVRYQYVAAKLHNQRVLNGTDRGADTGRKQAAPSGAATGRALAFDISCQELRGATVSRLHCANTLPSRTEQFTLVTVAERTSLSAAPVTRLLPTTTSEPACWRR
jgi:hypothetical protein